MAFRQAKLPSDIKNRALRGVDYNDKEREDVFDQFIKPLLKIGSNDPEQFKKSFLILEKSSDKKKIKLNVGTDSKRITFRKKRQLGLYNLGKKGLKYNDLVPLHELWKDYMMKYMKLNELKAQNWRNDPSDTNFEMVSQKLFRADYHGSEMTVARSKCYSLVGKSGIVAMETKNSFKLLGKDNIVRTVPKDSCSFEFNVDEFKFTVLGKNIKIRPADRSAKKLKSSVANDL